MSSLQFSASVTHTHTLVHTSFHRTFVLSAPVWCNSCMDSLCASPRSSSCLFRKLICCWVLSLLLSWRTHETNNDDGGQNSNYATHQTCPEVQGNTSTISTADLAINDLAGSNWRFISCSKWADILVHTSLYGAPFHEINATVGQKVTVQRDMLHLLQPYFEIMLRNQSPHNLDIINKDP